MNLGLNLMSHTNTASGGSGFIPGTVPKVVSSVIPASGDGVMVTFDRPMVMTKSLQLAMSVIKDGGPPVHPDHVLINPSNPKQIVLRYPAKFFTDHNVVTWSYNDQHPTEEIKGAESGGKEIDNQTYGVVNNTKIKGAFDSGFSKGFLI